MLLPPPLPLLLSPLLLLCCHFQFCFCFFFVFGFSANAAEEAQRINRLSKCKKKGKSYSGRVKEKQSERERERERQRIIDNDVVALALFPLSVSSLFAVVVGISFCASLPIYASANIAQPPAPPLLLHPRNIFHFFSVAAYAQYDAFFFVVRNFEIQFTILYAFQTVEITTTTMQGNRLRLSIVVVAYIIIFLQLLLFLLLLPPRASFS